MSARHAFAVHPTWSDARAWQWLVLLVWGCMVLANGGLAQTVSGADSTWAMARAKAADVAITQTGDAYALDAEGAVWRQTAQVLAQGTLDGWALQPGRFARLRATLDGSLWGLTATNDLYGLSGSVWRPLAQGVRDVAASPDGAVLLLLNDGRIVNQGTGQPLAQPPVALATAALQRLLSDEHGQPWLLLANGRLLRFSAGNWQEVAGPAQGARDVAIAGDGTVMAVNVAGQLFQRLARTGAWLPYSVPAGLQGQINQVALGETGRPWLIARNGSLVAERAVNASTVSVAKSPSLFTRLLSWRPVGGRSIGVGLGADGSAFSLSTDGSVWQWKTENRWTSVGGRFSEIAVGSRGAAWAMASGGDGRSAAFALDNGYWSPLPGAVKHIAAGPNNTVWAISGDDILQRWSSVARQWERLGAAPANARALAVGPTGTTWVVGADASVQTWSALSANAAGMQSNNAPLAAWVAVPGVSANSIAVGPDDTVYATSPQEPTLVWLDRRDMQWKPASGNAIAVAVGPEGAPWVVTSGNVLLASGRFLRDEANRAEAAKAAAAVPEKPVLTVVPAVLPSSQKPLVFEPVFSADVGFVDVGVGGNGAVFAVGSQGGLFCFSNSSRRFLLASNGSARRIAVSGAGQPWLLNSAGLVARFDRGAWTTVPEFLGIDLSIGPDGQAWAIDQNGDVNRLVGDRFMRVATQSSDAPFKALRLAGANAGVHWLVTTDNRLLRCERGNCATRMSGVQDVAVAPDNTVFLLDMAGKLRRANPQGSAFEVQNGTGVALAVGPQGLPWLVAADGKVSSAALANGVARASGNDACVLPFSNAPLPVAAPSTALRLNDVVTSVLPGGTVDLTGSTRLNGSIGGSFNGRPLALADVTFALNPAAQSLSLRDGVVIVSSNAPAGATLTGSYTACPKQGGVACGTARLAITVAGIGDAPRDVVALAGDAQAIVRFTPPGAVAGLPVVSYTVTAQPGGAVAVGNASPIAVTGLANGTAYSFTVTARYSGGTSQASQASAPVTPSALPAAPAGVTATPGNGQASVAFMAPANNGGAAVTGYTVTASPGGAVASAAASPVVVGGLTNGIAYSFTVSAINKNGAGPASQASLPVTPRGVAGAASAVVATPGNTQASVAFAAPTSSPGNVIIGYTVTASPGGAVASGAASPIAVGGLRNGTAYIFTVATRYAAGDTLDSGASAPVVPSTVPDAPTGVTALRDNASQTTASINFMAPANNGGRPITQYVVTASPGGATTAAAAAPITVTGLANGVAYTFVVRAVNANGAGAASAPSLQPTVPGVPTALVATLVSPGEAVLTYVPPTSNGGSPITGYTVASSPPGVNAVDPSGSALPLRVQGLQQGVSYTFTLSARNAVGGGTPSAASNAIDTSAFVPGQATGVVATRGNAQASVAFVPPANVGGSAISGYTVVASPGGATVSGAASPLVVNGLTNGTAYTFTVRAANAFGTGATSAASPAVTPATVPNAATGVTEELDTSTRAFVNFTPSASNGGSAITGYRVVTSPVDLGLVITQVAATRFQVTGLTATTAYTFSVVATNAVGDSVPSAPSAALRVASRPTGTGGVSGVAGAGSITVNFTGSLSDGGSPILSYSVYVFVLASGTPVTTVTSPTRPITVPGLTPGVAYCYFGWSNNINGRGTTGPACPLGGTTPF